MTDSMNNMLEIHSLETGYGARGVLKGVTLDVAPGEAVALIGPNGSGKTTLIRAISGVLRPTKGQISLAGADLTHMEEGERARRVAVVPQARDLPGSFTVEEVVMLGRTPYQGWTGVVSAQDRERVEWAIERAEISDLRERQVGELSGGEQQLVLLARALAQHTPVLLLDEPTAHLDLKHQSALLNLVRELASKENLAVLMALHDLNMAAIYSGRIALLVNGVLAALGDPTDVLTQEILEAAYQTPVSVITHPVYGTPLILPDGKK
jgi:iron complex transport system ATP-binding protein